MEHAVRKRRLYKGCLQRRTVMWVLVESSDDAARVVYGCLNNEPVVSTDLHLGQQLAVSYDNIRDHRTAKSFRV